MKTMIYRLIGLVLILTLPAAPVFAMDDVTKIKAQLEEMAKTMETLKTKLESMEKEKQKSGEAMDALNKRVDKNELHTATDKISLGVELRSKVDSIHYDGIQAAPQALMQNFFTPVASGGFNGATLNQIQQGMQNMAMAGMIPPTDKYDADNNAISTNKFNLDMKAKVNSNLNFAGRLAAYKVWGDSTGIKMNQGNLGDIALDGNTSSLPHGDTIHLERAYFVYSQNAGEVPVSFSLGHRPSTNGPPLEYGDYGLEGGSPLATIINWQFDGASLNFGLEDVTGIPGAAFKLCYGVGFEGDWGNSYSLKDTGSDVEDVNMFGFIATLFDDDSFSATMNYAHAWDITDGFTGLTLMPFIPRKADTNSDGVSEYFFDMNTGGYISRMEPSSEIGDWDALSLLMTKNLKDTVKKDIDLFLGLSWSRTSPSKISANPYYEMMGTGLLSSNGQLEDHDGYSIYAGALFPMPFDGRLGLEYNWGSQYWFNFTGAEDSLIGSKLSTRGSVYEGYYIQPIFGQNFFAKLGARYYDYDYTGSGNPMGAPVKIENLTSLDAMFPVVDKVWDAYISMTLRF